MASPRDLSPALLARARADQVGTLYAGFRRTTWSMLLGAALLGVAMAPTLSPPAVVAWLALVLANQAWRAVLVRAWRRTLPGIDAVPRWGRYWAFGTTMSGALWGVAALLLYPAEPSYQALLTVCLFGVVLGGLNLTAIYKPSFYGFVLAALVPLIARTAAEADLVHVNIALVLGVVLAFVLAFGHRVNDVLTQSIATRYLNVDLIAELKAQTRAAMDARAAAETANRAKSQLLAAASHDLRQPLHALGLFVAALAAKLRQPDVRPLVSRVQASLEALDGEFAQLLDLSRLEAGALVPARARVPLGPLLARIVGDHAPHAAAKGLRCAAAPTSLAVDSDPVLLERIVRNLVANAIRYTRHGGVVVGARRRGTQVAIEVADTGVGIPPEHADRVFDEFYQVPGRSSANGPANGMGLGLAIVRRLAVLLGHDVALRSHPGRGSRFTVLASRVTDVRAPRVHAPPTEAFAAGPDAIGGAIVIVIDDDPAAIEAMQELFATWGAVALGGLDVDTALAALGRAGCHPDLIVADLRLGDGGCGLDAIARLRDVLGATIPAIVISGDTGPEARAAVRGAALPLLPKPVVPAALHAASVALTATNRAWQRQPGENREERPDAAFRSAALG
jgi:signal transduction histidine kinase/CheY-like chemotaxis protein